VHYQIAKRMVEQDGSVVVNSVPNTDETGEVVTEKLLVLHPGQHFRRYFFGNESFSGEENVGQTHGSLYQPSDF
jgi:hypothetical protein